MGILDKVKLILGISDKDSLLTMLIDDCKSEVLDYCNLVVYDIKFDSTVTKMVVQNYNKSRIQGIASESFSGVSQSYINGYTADVIAILNKNRRMRFL